MSDDDQQTSTPKARPVKRKGHAPGLGTILSLVVAGIVFAVLALSLSGRSIPVPETLRANIEDRVNARLAGQPLSLGGMRFGIGRDGVPQVLMQDIRIADPAGGGVAYLNSLGANLSLDRLFRGRIAASDLILSGAQITIRRTADGSFAFRSDQLTETEAETLPQLLARIETVLDTPALASLKEIQAGGVVVTLEDARSGRIWQATNATIIVRRTDDGVSLSVTSDVFNGSDDVAEMQLSLSHSRITGHAALGVQISNMPAVDIALQSPVVSWLSVLDAPISGALRTEVDETGRLTSFAGTLDIAKGALRPAEDVPPAEFDAAQAYFTFDPDRQRIDFSQISLEGDEGALSATGHAYLAELNGPWPEAFLGQFRIDKLDYEGGGVFQAPVAFEDIRADLRLRLDPFTAEIAQIVIDNQGTPVTATGRIEARDGGWHAAIDAASPQITGARVLELWPLKVSPISRAWLAANLKEGLLRNPAAGVRLVPGQKPDIALSFEFEDGTTSFLPAMPDLERVGGRVTMLNHDFTLGITEGGVTASTGEWLEAAGSVFRVKDVRPKPAWGTIEIAAAGPLSAVLTVLNNPPLRIMERAKRSADFAEARTQTHAVVELPLVNGIRNEDVTYDVTARLQDVRSDRLVEDRVFSASELKLAATEDGISINGNARLDGVPLTANWRQPFGEGADDGGRITGEIALSPETMSSFNIPLPDGLLQGRTTAQYDLTLPITGAPDLALTSDLTGLALAVPSINFRKPASSDGELVARLSLGDVPEFREFKVATDGLSLDGTLNFSDAGFRSATFSEVRVDDWLDARLSLTPQGAGTAIAITGGTFDLRRFESGSSGGGRRGSDGGTIEVNLDRLIVSDSVTLSPIRGKIKQGPFGLSGQFQARVNGGTPIAGTLSPANGGTAIRIQADDAAGVIRDAALTPNTQLGNLDVVLTPVAGAPPGTYDGQFLIENIRLRNAPVMADLLDAISVVGLLDQLSGPGIKFSSIDGRFRLTPRRIQILEAAAVGPSIGVSADGLYDFSSKRLDVRGVISPVYFLNGIGSIFTRRGEGLFGFNYRVRGSVKDPQVRVNPLSIFTPGMFRRIFRSPPPRG